VTELTAVIFSKDRPLQLDATIRSLRRNCSDLGSADLRVLYAASTPALASLYEVLAFEHPDVQFRREADFRRDLIDMVKGPRHIMFLVDDSLFVGPTSLRQATSILDENESLLGFSFRLGRNTTYCYPLDAQQALPDFEAVGSGLLVFDWTDAQHDFGYPIEVSSSLYRSSDLLPLIQTLNYRNPNTLEGAFAAEAIKFRGAHPRLACHERSVAVSIPANLVQTATPNRAAERSDQSVASLAEAFTSGRRLDLERYQGLITNACHQEMELFLLGPASAPIVSVVIPCYDQAQVLPDAVQSVIAQTFSDWEVIVVDDGSPDDTALVAQTLMAAHPSRRIRLLSRSNGGVSSARNAGIAISSGRYVLPLDADDTIAPEMLAMTVTALETNPNVTIAYTDYEKFGMEQGQVQAPEFDAALVPTINQFSYCSLFRRRAWLEVGGYNPNMSSGYEDWDFWVGCVKAGFSAMRVRGVGFRYRVRSGSRTSQALGRDRELRGRIRRNHPSLYSVRRRLGRGLHRLARSVRIRSARRPEA
jgi:glycosyltransferase involved in cell wall biosynthesis